MGAITFRGDGFQEDRGSCDSTAGPLLQRVLVDLAVLQDDDKVVRRVRDQIEVSMSKICWLTWSMGLRRFFVPASKEQ